MLCGFSVYIFDNSKSKSMVRLFRAEKMVLSGLVFSRMGADKQNIVLGFWLTTFFCPFRFLKQRPIIKNSFLTNILWFLFTSSRTKWFLFYSSRKKWYESTWFIIHSLEHSKSPGLGFCFICSDIEHWDIYAYSSDAREDINSYNNVFISKCMYFRISKKWKNIGNFYHSEPNTR